jgi:nicotinamidase/pyrazinamidase
MKALGVIDIQNDFINKEGALYVPGAEKIKDNLKATINAAKSDNTPIFFTADSHDGTEPEMSKNGGPFPYHCINGTEGQKIIEEVSLDGAILFEKRCYNVFDPELGNKKIVSWIKDNNIEEVYLIGVVGNICVEAAAIGLVNMGVKVTLIEKAIVWMYINDQNNEKISRERLIKAGVSFK